MMSATQPRIDRREWLARCARPAVLMGIVLLVLRLLRRDRQGVCRHPELRCGGCQLLTQCDTRRAHLAVTARRLRTQT
jgi:hypothetical protein